MSASPGSSRVWAGFLVVLAVSLTVGSAEPSQGIPACRPSVQSCNLQDLAAAAAAAGTTSTPLAGAVTSATLNFEPGGWENLFNWQYYYVPPSRFSNSYPRSPDNVPVADDATEYRFSDGVSEWTLDLSTNGIITLTARILEAQLDLYTAVVKVSSSVLQEPRSGGVVKVSDNFTQPVTAELSEGTLVLRAPGAHIEELGSYVATFQLKPCAPGSPCCNADGQLKPQGTQCRASPGPCAEPALCTGTSSACPDNPLKPAGTVCGSSQPCKQQPFCNGQVATCPDGSNRPERTPCLRDGQTAQFPIAQAGRMSLDACRGQCAAGACQLRLNKQGCCYTSEQVNRKTVKTVHCWQ